MVLILGANHFNMKDKTGKSKVFFNYGWSISASSSRLSTDTNLITGNDFWISAIIRCDDFLSERTVFSGIGNNDETGLFIGTNRKPIWKEDNIVVFMADILITAGKDTFICIQRLTTGISIWVESQQFLIQSSRGSLVRYDRSFMAYAPVYDLRIYNGSKVPDIDSLTQGKRTNEKYWFPIQFGSGNGARCVLTKTDLTSAGLVWERKRTRSFYNQIYRNEKILYQYGISESAYIFDDGATFFDFSNSKNDLFDKRAYAGNCFGLKEYYKDSIYLSQFYEINDITGNYKVWNIKELFVQVWKQYFNSGDVTFFNWRKLESDVPIAISNIIIYNKLLTDIQKQYVYNFIGGNVEEIDEEEDYPIIDISTRNDIAFDYTNPISWDSSYSFSWGD